MSGKGKKVSGGGAKSVAKSREHDHSDQQALATTEHDRRSVEAQLWAYWEEREALEAEIAELQRTPANDVAQLVEKKDQLAALQERLDTMDPPTVATTGGSQEVTHGAALRRGALDVRTLGCAHAAPRGRKGPVSVESRGRCSRCT